MPLFQLHRTICWSAISEDQDCAELEAGESPLRRAILVRDEESLHCTVSHVLTSNAATCSPCSWYRPRGQIQSIEQPP
jgi:hypothetical protein